jgi:crotonobetainyl-CoA:carnitine CoA-transferase CaiB-like acyl-CoA transferase
MSFQPLRAVRVVDLTSVVVGPVCNERLVQYGAEVIKVESPDGDLMRDLGGQSPTGKHSGTYLHLNRGKRNLCCDLKTPASREIMQRLIASADVVIANMRPDALTRLGLDALTIRTRHPEKIYCLITGYGTDGPYAGQPTYDSVIQAASGVTGLTLARDGRPAYVPMVFCDHVVGEVAAGAILAALLQRNLTGDGCSIEVPMFETMAAFVLQEHLAQHSFDPPVGPPGDLRLLSPHNRPVKTADGWISFTINTDQQVRAFLKSVGRSELLDDARFATVASRAKHVNEWFEVRGAPLPEKTTREWLDAFAEADIAAKPCHTLESLSQDPHLTQVGLLQPAEHPTEGRTIAIRSTIRFDDSYGPLPSFAQPQGWETRAILKEIGYSVDEVDGLIADKVAIVHAP